MPRKRSKTKLDPFDDIFGTYVDPARAQQNLAAYSTVLLEIAKLRKLDLTDVHPAIVFDPTAAYREER